MQKEGISFEHGRIGTQTTCLLNFINQEFGFILLIFPEISCITAMKAQACGCVPVIADYAALKKRLNLA